MATILVVEDDRGIRDLLTVLLGDEGHEVTTASEGAEAVAMILAAPPDLVILDLMMPSMDGLGVLKELKRLNVRDTTKVLVLTAKRSELDWAQGFKLGADDYLTKPFEVDELVDAVNRVLEMSRTELRARRQQELDKAQLLSQLESMFGQ